MARKPMSPAVKAQAVQMIVSEERTVTQVCTLLGVGPTAVRRWVAQWRVEQKASGPRSASDAQADRQRIRDLERTLAQLQEERDLLKKSIAFFVRENDHFKK